MFGVPLIALPSVGGRKIMNSFVFMIQSLARTAYDEVMQVHVDPKKCQGHNRCYALAPDLFDVDDYGNAFELHEGVVPVELEDKARRVAANCPEFAILIEEKL
jgi:ferredoxin